MLSPQTLTILVVFDLLSPIKMFSPSLRQGRPRKEDACITLSHTLGAFNFATQVKFQTDRSYKFYSPFDSITDFSSILVQLQRAEIQL